MDQRFLYKVHNMQVLSLGLWKPTYMVPQLAGMAVYLDFTPTFTAKWSFLQLPPGNDDLHDLLNSHQGVNDRKSRL